MTKGLIVTIAVMLFCLAVIGIMKEDNRVYASRIQSVAETVKCKKCNSPADMATDFERDGKRTITYRCTNKACNSKFTVTIKGGSKR